MIAISSFHFLAYFQPSPLKEEAYLNLEPKKYLLATIHRPSNSDIPKILTSILETLGEIGETVIFPLHPRTRKNILDNNGLRDISPNIRFIEPVGYLDMLMLEQHTRLIITDSGGIQKEAYFLSVPCVTLRSETEWVETIESGWNILVDVENEDIGKVIRNREWPKEKKGNAFGNGRAAYEIANIL